jgi:hypothetical protein
MHAFDNSLKLTTNQLSSRLMAHHASKSLLHWKSCLSGSENCAGISRRVGKAVSRDGTRCKSAHCGRLCSTAANLISPRAHRNQILTLPTLTTYSLPFALPLIDIVFTLPSTLILHLNTNEDGEVEDEDDAALHSDEEVETEGTNGELKMDGETERRLIITKWEERSVLDSMLNRNEMVKNLCVYTCRLCLPSSC